MYKKKVARNLVILAVFLGLFGGAGPVGAIGNTTFERIPAGANISIQPVYTIHLSYPDIANLVAACDAFGGSTNFGSLLNLAFAFLSDDGGAMQLIFVPPSSFPGDYVVSPTLDIGKHYNLVNLGIIMSGSGAGPCADVSEDVVVGAAPTPTPTPSDNELLQSILSQTQTIEGLLGNIISEITTIIINIGNLATENTLNLIRIVADKFTFDPDNNLKVSGVLTNAWQAGTALGNGFIMTTDIIILPNQSETNTLLLRNPTSSGKTLRLNKIAMGLADGEKVTTLRIYRNPTIASNGSVAIINNLLGSGGSSAAQVFRTPTVSLKGALLDSVRSSSVGRDLEYDLGLNIEPGENILITLQGSVNNSNNSLSLTWLEQ